MTRSTKPRSKLSLLGLLLALLGAWLYSELGGEGSGDGGATPPVGLEAPASATSAPRASDAPRSSAVGFTSQRSWQSHFEKHGHEFGDITAEEYLALAQTLRDAPLSQDVIEAIRAQDDVRTRFDRRSGAFLAFHADQTIRTFFVPNDGEAYFERQLTRAPEGDR